MREQVVLAIILGLVAMVFRLWWAFPLVVLSIALPLIGIRKKQKKLEQGGRDDDPKPPWAM